MEDVIYNELDFILVLFSGFSLPDMLPTAPTTTSLSTQLTPPPLLVYLQISFSLINPFKITTFLPLLHDRVPFTLLYIFPKVIYYLLIDSIFMHFVCSLVPVLP